MEKIIIELEVKTKESSEAVKKLNKTFTEANKSTKNLNEELLEQKEILLLLERELLNVENQLKNTSKANLAGQKKLRTESNHLKSSLKDQRISIKELVLEKSQSIEVDKKNILTYQESSKALKLLDSLTGGYASKTVNLFKGLKSSAKALKTFNIGLSGMKKALIATGVGALVVALGLVVAYWDDIVELFQDANKELVDQETKINKTIDAQTVQLGLLKQQIGLQELQTGESKKLTKEYRKQLILQREQNIALLENLLAQEQLEDSKSKELTFFEKAKIAASALVGVKVRGAVIADTYIKKSAKSVELQKKINDAKSAGLKIDTEIATLDKNVEAKAKKISDEKIAKQKVIDDAEIEAEKLKAEAIERIRKGLIDTEAEERAEKLRLIKIDYDEQIALAEEYYGKESEQVLALRLAQDIAKKEQQQVFDNEDTDRANKTAADEKAIKDKSVADEIELEAKRVAAKHQALSDISSIFGAESAMGKAALIAKQLMAAQELLIDLGAIKSKATKAIVGSQLNAAESGGAVATGFSKTLALGFPAAIPALIGYVASAAGIVSGVMAATKKTKSVASSFGGTGGGGGGSAPSLPAAPSLPPAFNVVGASDTNQLADAIGGQSQEPVKAYVVSGDVTSAQSMDRNIVEGASI